MQNITLIHGECLKEMDKLIKQNIKVDAIITDEPYGTTQCKWDEAIPFADMWKRLKLLRKNEHIPTLLFGSEPFSSRLRLSNIKEYKYDWVWDKVRGVGHLNAKKRPMMNTENILVFYKKQVVYNPQMRVREISRISKNNATQKVYGKSKNNFVGNKLYKKYPINLITFSKSSAKDMLLHPTQKPVKLMEYLIKTYTKENDLVLDFTMGSGTTGVACKNLNRRFIGIEKEQKYYDIAVKRLKIQTKE